MGGNALKNVKTNRLNKVDYEKLSKVIKDKLSEVFNQVEITKAYNNKADFGDLDILVEQKEDCDVGKSLKELFNYTQLYSNGNCHSFDINNFQVDVIVIPQEIFKIASVYYAYNDLGNLQGRIANGLGFKYGHEGLTFPYRKGPTNVVGKIKVSTDPEKIHSFLGYDFNTYTKSFNTLEQIFKYAASTKYFNKSLFLLDNLNHINRTRNRKRNSYMQFLQWLNEYKCNDFQYNKDTTEYLTNAISYFPEANIPNQIKDVEDKLREKEEIRSKFSGHIIKQLRPELQGEELGKFIANFKKNFMDNQTFEAYVLKSSALEIEESIRLGQPKTDLPNI